MEDDVQFELQAPIKYGAENNETSFIVVRCPSYDSAGKKKYRRDLKAMLAAIFMDESGKKEVTETQREQAQEKVKDGELPFTVGQVLLTISGALGDDFSKAVDRFSSNADSCCFVGGDEPLKEGVIRRMHPDDVDLLFCTFIASFIMPSFLKSLTGSK